MVAFNVRWTGDKLLTKEILRVEQRARYWQPVLNALADDFEQRVMEQQFRTQGKYGTMGGWTPVKPETLEAKLAKGQDPRTLHANLRLRHSLTQRSHPEHVRRVKNESLELGTTVPYFRPLTEGVPSRNIVPRPIVVFPRARKTSWQRSLNAFLRDGTVRRP